MSESLGCCVRWQRDGRELWSNYANVTGSVALTPDSKPQFLKMGGHVRVESDGGSHAIRMMLSQADVKMLHW